MIADLPPIVLTTVLPMVCGLGVLLLERRFIAASVTRLIPAAIRGRSKAAKAAVPFLCVAFSVLAAFSAALEGGAWTTTETFAGPFHRDTASSRMLGVRVGQHIPLKWFFEVRGDDARDPAASRLQLWIDGKPRLPPHTSGDAIEAGNRGFSHWGEWVHFSLAPDQTDDARTKVSVSYQITVKPPLAALFTFAALFLGLLSVGILLPRVLLVTLQVVLLYACGYDSLAGLTLVIAMLSCVAAGLRSKEGLGKLPSLTAVGGSLFFVYWIFQKYALPLIASPSTMGSWLFGPASVFAVVGISFMGFKLIHFLVDYRDGSISDARPLEVVGWLLFFPSIIAGPMQRFQDWQAQRAAPFDAVSSIAEGLRSLLIGMILKFVLADSIHNMTVAGMSEGVLATTAISNIFASTLLYYLYLYWDFAGYSRMAIGVGLFWGIRLPENFNHPYIARNLSEFWNRWHITLSHLLRDYLFYPLSIAIKRRPTSRRHPRLATIIPPVATFLFAGVWHGAGVGYVLYGLMHGIGLAYLALIKRRRQSSAFRRWWEGSRIGYAGGMIITYLYVSTSFLFFCLDYHHLAILFGRLF